MQTAPGSKTIWKISKGFRKNRCQTKSLIIDGVQICESKGKADAIAEEFEKYHKVSLNNTLSEEHNVHEYLENFNNQSSIIVEHNSFTNIVELKFFIWVPKIPLYYSPN